MGAMPLGRYWRTWAGCGLTAFEDAARIADIPTADGRDSSRPNHDVQGQPRQRLLPEIAAIPRHGHFRRPLAVLW